MPSTLTIVIWATNARLGLLGDGVSAFFIIHVPD